MSGLHDQSRVRMGSVTAVARWQYAIPSKNGKSVDVFARVPLVLRPSAPDPQGS